MENELNKLLVSHNWGISLLDGYREMLRQHPLMTQTLTGGILALLGDALAQAKSNFQTFERNDGTTTKNTAKTSYNHRRAISFMVFDMAYRIAQHFIFPWIANNCHGQHLDAFLCSLGLGLFNFDATVGSAIEGTMVNQLLIVPLLYYPVFFLVTGWIQGMTITQGYKRAQSMWLPLLKRNLVFWVPVQFIQFRFIEESLQIPFVCVAGLCWTIILSAVAGNTQEKAALEALLEDSASRSLPMQVQEQVAKQQIERNGTIFVVP